MLHARIFKQSHTFEKNNFQAYESLTRVYEYQYERVKMKESTNNIAYLFIQSFQNARSTLDA